MFAITAITGRVGGELANTLLGEGHDVRAIVRNEDRGAPWAAKGCEIAVASLEDAEDLTKALTGVEGAFILFPPLYDTDLSFSALQPRIEAVRRALVQAQPRKVVVLSTIGADAKQPNLLNALGKVETALAEVALPITYLRAAWFIENAEWDVAAARDEGILHSYLQPLDRAIPMISTADVGRTAAELLLEDWNGQRVVELEASSRVTPVQMAKALSHALGRSVSAVAVPCDQWESIFREQGMHNPLPRMQMIDGFNEGWIDFKDQGAHARKGAVSLEEAITKLVIQKG
ncbi:MULTISPECIES: NmrA family NAD(P)-binding protein [unclassified Luteibacter]|uniref:NmrA family NAD(P)-binding protein n=1 Tax=Luteibacter sp. PvP019 TaxID=3156436 RepID=UPI0033948082